MSTPTQTVTAVYEAFGRGDIPAVLGALTDDVEWTFDGSSGEAWMRTARGKEDVQRWFAQALADEIQVFEPRQMLPGPDHVTVFGWERALTQPSGGIFESTWVHVWQLHGGKISRFFGMFDTAALARARAGAALAN